MGSQLGWAWAAALFFCPVRVNAPNVHRFWAWADAVKHWGWGGLAVLGMGGLWLLAILTWLDSDGWSRSGRLPALDRLVVRLLIGVSLAVGVWAVLAGGWVILYATLRPWWR